MKVGTDFPADFLYVDFDSTKDIERGAKIQGRITAPQSRTDVWEQIELCKEAIRRNGSSIAMLGSGDRKIYPVRIVDISSSDIATYITIRAKFYVLAGFDRNGGRVYLPKFGPGADEPELGDVGV